MLVLAVALVASGGTAAAQGPPGDPAAPKDAGLQPIIVVGLGRIDPGEGPRPLRIEEPQHVRELVSGGVRSATQRPVIDHAELRGQLGADYLDRFASCRGEPDCVLGLVGPLRARAQLAIYGDYEVAGDSYRIHLRLVDQNAKRLAGEARFELRGAALEDPARWGAEIGALLAAAGVAEAPPPAEGTGPPAGGGAGDAPPGGGAGDAPPELPPLETDPTGPGTDGGKDGSFVDNSALESLSRGVIWHGHLQMYAALGIRKGFRGDLELFENRLQLDLESHVGPLRIVGRPQIIYDGLTNDIGVGLRELYATREYERFELSFGDRILTWGITDFWPVVDIVNPRNFRQLRNWRPIDEKLPAPVIQGTAVLGRFTIQALAIILARSSPYQLDRTRPFAIPIAVPETVPILLQEPEDSLDNSGGGGASVSAALGSWKTGLYALWGRNPLPTVFARVDLATGAPEVRVENERVAMVAASAQGTVDAIDALVKTEAAFYARIDDRCEDAIEIAPGTPSCFYLRRVPNARATVAIEREVASDLTAHLQLIGELTRSADAPPLPPAAQALAPGLERQHRFNPIATLRLQGHWKRGDFRPMAFFYWSIAEEEWFANVDLEYHLTDGFALAAGGFWFEGYADDPNKNLFTVAGSLESSSNVYLRATAWF